MRAWLYTCVCVCVCVRFCGGGCACVAARSTFPVQENWWGVMLAHDPVNGLFRRKQLLAMELLLPPSTLRVVAQSVRSDALETLTSVCKEVPGSGLVMYHNQCVHKSSWCHVCSR